MGNPLRSDDNIGNYLAEKVGGFVGGTNPENLIGKLTGEKTIVFIDAVEFVGNVGEVRLFDLDEIADQLITTHNIPVSMFTKLLPEAEIKVIGIKIENRDFGKDFSDGMKQKLPVIEKEVRSFLKTLSA